MRGMMFEGEREGKEGEGERRRGEVVSQGLDVQQRSERMSRLEETPMKEIAKDSGRRLLTS